jgi:tetratricopeptide (TPR) repeat protein
VSQTISRVVHKAMAKQPWNRFDIAREFGDTLQKAARNEPIALSKLQEVLNLDPTNAVALSLKNKIDDRRSERQIEKWVRLAQQHVDNHAYGHAREAIQNALALRPRDSRASKLLKTIEIEEQEYVRLRQEKVEIYQAAVNLWKNGEVSQALSRMRPLPPRGGRGIRVELPPYPEAC